MSISFEYRAPPGTTTEAGESWSFGDEVQVVRIGRDPQQCQVALLSNVTTFGREHCRIVFQSGRYALETDSLHRVFWNDKEVFAGATLDGEGRLRLGAEGPTLFTRILSRNELPQTDQRSLGESPLLLARRADSLSKRGLWIGIATALILAVCGIAAFNSIWGLGRQIDQGTAQSKQLAVKLAQEAAAKPTPIVWANIFDRAAPSIGLVMIRDADGNDRAAATAWVVDADRRQFATNSHVGKLLAQLNSTTKLVVRTTGANSADFEIVSATIHPGYDAFSEAWDDYAPARSEQAPPELIRSAGPAYDVALLQASDPGPPFPPALRIADDSALEKLVAGQPLGAIGFPMEGLALGGVNVKQPVPFRHLAYIAAVTDYFGRPGDEQNPRYLVQHAIPSTGGASGSPILNDRGEVIAVHNAGNVIGDMNGVRVEASAMIFFSQRADLVRELLKDRAQDLQAQRVASWQKSLRAEYVPAVRILRAEFMSEAKTQCAELFEANELVAAAMLEPIPLVTTALDPQKEASTLLGRWTFDAPRSTRYLAFATTENSSGAIAMSVQTSITTDNAATGSQGSPDWRVTSNFLAVAGEQVTLEVSGTVGDFPVTLEVFAAEPGDMETEELIEKRIESWLLEHDSEIVETIVDQMVKLKKTAGVNQLQLDLNLAKPGTYLCVVVPEQFDALRVEARQPSKTAEPPWFSESRLGLTTWASGEISDAGAVQFAITAKAAEDCRVRVLRVKDSSSP